MRPSGLGEFLRTIGYQFADPSLLTAALTHTSASIRQRSLSYQRLEFLGDRVLGLVIADALYRRFGVADEGELALRFNHLVRRETLASIAREINLGRNLIVGAGEHQGGGRDKDAILADSLEALLGALYLDGGLSAARTTIESLWESRLDAQLHAPRDPKTKLQEWSQGEGYGLPEYAELSREGPDHSPKFTVEVRLGAFRPARGVGSSKREAERDAAKTMLEREVDRDDA